MHTHAGLRACGCGEARTFPPAAGLLRSKGTDAMRIFLPVAPGSQGRRGFGTAPTKRLATLLRRYRHLRDDPTADPRTRTHAGQIVSELHDEFTRWQELRRPEIDPIHRHESDPGRAA